VLYDVTYAALLVSVWSDCMVMTVSYDQTAHVSYDAARQTSGDLIRDI